MLAIEQRYWRGVRVVGASIIADSVLGQSLGKPQRDFGGLAPTLISEKQRETENGSRRSRKTARQLKPFQPGVSGNPNGRPAGGRTVFSQGFLQDLASVARGRS